MGNLREIGDIRQHEEGKWGMGDKRRGHVYEIE